jgi:alpha-D-ribose 1-methylphosphonate 5-triphosphate synthase subunit PhnL
MSQPILKVSGLTKTFVLHLIDGRSITPVADLAFDVWPAQHFLISGRSGIGKTSILKCIYRSYLASAGEIWFDSLLAGPIELIHADESTILRVREREIGYCAQFLRVLPRIAALDILAEPLMRQGATRQAARDESAAWLQRLGIAEPLWHASPVTFSGGEQQRINLGRAFIAAPRLLLLDEPTASLDGASRQVVIQLIDDARQRGITVLTVSHDLDTLLPSADARLHLT